MREWIAFALAGLFWGSSFLWIKIALDGIGPFGLVAYRLLFGALGLIFVLNFKKKKFPRDFKIIRNLWIMSLLNPGIPFVLISWGETKIDSSLASVLNATVPLFTIVLAHFFLTDEKISRSRLLGLIIGFIGVVTLVSKDLDLSKIHGSFLGQLAILGASFLYGCATVFSRRNLRGLSPIVQATGVMCFADVQAWLAYATLENPLAIPHQGILWLALAWLGLLGSCAAFLCYFHLLNTWGATRASLVNYVFPVVGLVLGIFFRGEVLSVRMILGSVFIFSGIIVVNYRTFQRVLLPAKA